MKAEKIGDFLRSIGSWVNWDKTVDKFLYGDPNTEVKGIATAWIPTNACLKAAHDKNLNLFITHEPSFYYQYQGQPSTDKLISKKKSLLDNLGITLLRCHDTWDRMPGVGIVDAWAQFLGFETEKRSVESFYNICLLNNISVEAVANQMLRKVRSLGQDTIVILGDRNKQVNRMAIGTGAITWFPDMYKLRPDLILATDDGMKFYEGALWAVDMGIPVIIVNHAVSEKPGMQAMAQYLRGKFPKIPCKYLDIEFQYSHVG